MWFWALCVSLAVNLLLFYYIRWLLKTLSVINEDVVNVSALLSDFTRHTESIYEMEMFYGDETLKSLITHSKELTDRLTGLDLVINEPDEAIEEGEVTHETA